MLNIMEYTDLSEQIADQINALPISQKYKKLQHEIKQNSDIKQLIQIFEKAKQEYEEVERYGSKYHPNYKKVSQQLIEAKTSLYQNEVIKELKVCEKEIQLILDQIASYLESVKQIKTIKAKASCGCGSGGCSR